MVSEMEKFIAFITKKEVYGTIIILFGSYIVYNLLRLIMDKRILNSKSEFEKKRRKTVTELFKKVIKAGILVVAIIIILDLFGVNVSAAIASLGIASAVSALSFQDTLKDVISGSTIIMDNYFMVGDYVKYNGFYGKVIELGFKSTKIENFDGEVLVVANRNISEITNISQKTASALIEIPTAYEEKADKVEKVLTEVLEEISNWETMKKDKNAFLGITELGDSAIKYAIRIYCSPGKVAEYKRKTLKIIKEKYDKNKIKIPYNQIEVHNETKSKSRTK